MTYGHSSAQRYHQVGTSGAAYADPHRLIQMLLEGALTRIAVARGAIERSEAGPKGVEIGKAISIISGLRDSLNHERGGELAGNLEALYAYMQRRLLEASARNDPAGLDEVARLLREIKSGWDGIADTVPRAPAPPAGGLDAQG